MSGAFRVAVPATTANIGPGFDCLGAALTRYNHFTFASLPTAETLQITVQGLDSDRVTTDASNLAYVAFQKFFHKIGQPVPALSLEIELDVPLARGMGSSSTAIVGGILGANAMAGEPLDAQALADFATEIEGHPDNVVPALLGGCRLTTVDDAGTATVCEVPWHPDIIPILVVPAFEVSTAQARAVLPTAYSRADAVYTMGHLGLLIQALATGNGDWLRTAIGDRIHEPYRKSLIPGYDAVTQAARDAGAYGVTISGAGPTLLALGSADRAAAIAQAMAQAWQQTGIEIVDATPLAIDTTGSTVTAIN
ncbi:homoserine kinase [Leptolyngbya iicbica]|uniref:Homoserine kinase n=2 Tax=Cyanophyceae TaxID=3028117 RepID=A0A4Q7EAY2_9CYAN|nr:homoserine kinase [Leptolyngbya sp. LK]RZM79781.1 homoserine kinase [Leptolyngbya sp. LK]